MIKTTTMLRRSLLAALCGLTIVSTGATSLPVYATSRSADQGDQNDDDDDDDGDDDDQGSESNKDDAEPDKRHVRYAVQIYAIKEDTAARDANGTDAQTAGLTFGPAIGVNYIGNDEDGDPRGASHTPTEGETSELGYDLRCVHDDSWATIIEWNETDPTVYKECLESGCTKSIILTRTLGKNAGNSDDYVFYYDTDESTGHSDARTNRVEVTGDGPSVLYSELQDDARIWAENHDRFNGSSLNWMNSKVRAMLNGAQADETVDVYGGSKYTEDNSILSALPEVLRDAIGYKENSYEYGYTVDDDGDAETSDDTCYDRLWLLATSELYDEDDLAGYITGEFNYTRENTRYSERTSSLTPDHVDSSSDKWYESATGYKVDAGKSTPTGVKANYWLRSAVKSTNIYTEKPGTAQERTYDERYSYMANVASYGLNNADTHWTYSGIAFGFTLYRENQDPVTPVDPGDPGDPSSPSDDSHGDGGSGSGSSSGTTVQTTTDKTKANGATGTDGTVGVDGTTGGDGTGVTDDGVNTGNLGANGDLDGNAIGATGDNSLMTTYGVVAGTAAILLVVWFATRRRGAEQ